MKIKKLIEDLIWKYKERKRFKTAPIYKAKLYENRIK